MSQDVYEDEVKSLVKTIAWNTLANYGVNLSDVEENDEMMEELATEVWSAIWEYISDPD